MKTRAFHAVFVVMLALVMLAPASARAQTVEWSQELVSPRRLHAMSYDSARGVTVLFGGSALANTDNSFSRSNAETWEWDGSAWTQFPVSGPSPRFGRRSDRKSTRLNSSHSQISYAVFCLKKKNNDHSPHSNEQFSLHAHLSLLHGHAP